MQTMRDSSRHLIFLGALFVVNERKNVMPLDSSVCVFVSDRALFLPVVAPVLLTDSARFFQVVSCLLVKLVIGQAAVGELPEVPAPAPVPEGPAPAPAPEGPPPAPGTCGVLFAQCGGIGFNGPTCCEAGVCVTQNVYYSQCIQVHPLLRCNV